MFSEVSLQSASTLMHPVEAMNHRKSGFFPTDVGTMDNILSKLIPHGHGINILDPCCGKGEALAQFKKVLPNAQTYGIELDAKRYEQAQSVLDYAYYADMYDVKLGRNQFDVLFLNPPYGNDMADKLGNDKTERLEHKFLTQTFPALKADGLLVYIVPAKSIDEARIKWLLTRFKDLTICKAAVDTYKQVVVMGIKLKQQRAVNATMVEEFINKRESLDELPMPSDIDYEVPYSTSKAKLVVKRLNAVGVAEVMKRFTGQWSYFDALFTHSNTAEFRRPLHRLSDWHLALMITSGAVWGTVSNGIRTLLVKGMTKKHKDVSQTQQVDDNTHTVTTVIESKDRFTAQIKAIDIDVNSPYFGEVITIK